MGDSKKFNVENIDPKTGKPRQQGWADQPKAPAMPHPIPSLNPAPANPVATTPAPAAKPAEKPADKPMKVETDLIHHTLKKREREAGL